MHSIVKNARRGTQENFEQRSTINSDFSVGNNIKTEYDMWSWIYQEVANLRNEVSRVGLLVRINNEASPEYLEVYHAHIYSLLLPISPVINASNWNIIEKQWLLCKIAIEEYMKKKANVSNIKVPFELIRKLDKLHRLALIYAQKAGMGVKITLENDIDKQIEAAITGINT